MGPGRAPELLRHLGRVLALEFTPGRALLLVGGGRGGGGGEARPGGDLVVQGLGVGRRVGHDDVQTRLGQVGAVRLVVGLQGTGPHRHVPHRHLELLLIGQRRRTLAAGRRAGAGC